jgi:hypothetical protein
MANHNQKVIKMLPIILANSFDISKWSSKVFSENRTEGAMTFPVVEGKSPPRTENEVSRGQWS